MRSVQKLWRDLNGAPGTQDAKRVSTNVTKNALRVTAICSFCWSKDKVSVTSLHPSSSSVVDISGTSWGKCLVENASIQDKLIEFWLFLEHLSNVKHKGINVHDWMIKCHIP